ncbi:hypothetical protein NECAME_00838 [Necator americanus]|uniref:Uncharacterized protein n=1 Tax=Necator americanus TaxID=51031 RepID=W2SN85_NECAM|nr:hypothetical protein NECAME_00838 [Necator americanus]ETN71149.1 hypothetical protein NECAME_00838 [Necator americanus]
MNYRMKVTAVGPQMRAFTLRVRQFSAQPQYAHPAVVFVKEAAGRQNSLLGPADKQFPLPGDVCHKMLLQEQPIVKPSIAPSVLDVNTHSVQDLLSTSRVDADPHYSAKVEELVLEEAQTNAGDWPVELTVQECPRLLKRDMKHLFPGMNFDNVNVTVMNIAQKSENDMKAWSEEMQEERDMLTASFISSATAMATTLRRCGYWADFIDPSSGRPYLGKFTNHALFETDDAYKDMGFRIEDLGCCKVLQHVAWGTHAFVGTLFTDAPPDCQIVQDIVRKVNTDEIVVNNRE